MRCGTFLALAMLALAACEQPSTWIRPGASQAEFDADREQCLQTSQQQLSAMHVKTFGGYDGSREGAKSPLFAACMRGRGWSPGASSGFTAARGSSAADSSQRG